MAVYKVPQDVEADDKLIGPFSFRQFIYLIVAAISIIAAWGLAQLFIPLAILPLPLIVFFGALALPLKKDQPMETYLAAVVSFHLKPRKRLWSPDGIESTIEITAPKVIEVQRTKDLTQTEAERRLSYLADIVDTQGWAVRGVAGPASNTGLNDATFMAGQQAEDVLDSRGGIAQSFDTMIAQADARRRQEVLEHMRQAPQVQTRIREDIAPPRQVFSPAPVASDDPQVTFNPYPASIHQAVIDPLDPADRLNQPIPQPVPSKSPPTQETHASVTAIPPDIIDLANNPDLSIETMAHEAHRIVEKHRELPEEEVVISLR